MTQRLHVDRSAAREALVLRLSGSVDRSSSSAVSRALADATASVAPPSVVVVDLCQVDMLSADGVRVLQILTRASSARGIRCRLLIVPGSAVDRTIDMADPGQELVRFDDLHRALADTRTDDPHARTTPPQGPLTGPAPKPAPGVGHRDRRRTSRYGDGADKNALAVVLSDMARSLQRQHNLKDTMDGIVSAAISTVPGAEHAGLMVVRGRGDVETAASTSGLVVAVDRAQYDTRQGPCLDAVHGTTAVRVIDMARERRWPAFAQRARELGVRSMLSLRLHVTGDKLGGLNLYAARPDAFDDESEQVGMLLATHAAVAMAGARREQDLNHAVAARDIIGQAKGILMERHKISSDEAFRFLVRTSQHANIKVSEIARYLTDAGELRPPQGR
jgi:anti-anti-sigma factor